MPRRDPELIASRNKKVEKTFNEVCLKNPKWKHEEQIKETAKIHDIKPRTVSAILSGEYDRRKEAAKEGKKDPIQIQLF